MNIHHTIRAEHQPWIGRIGAGLDRLVLALAVRVDLVHVYM